MIELHKQPLTIVSHAQRGVILQCSPRPSCFRNLVSQMASTLHML